VLTELAEQLRAKNLALDLGWVPRDQNEEADALTNSDFSSFDPDRRIATAVDALPFLVMPRMLAVAEDINQVVKAAREARVAGAASASRERAARQTRPEERLRARDPWL
jgi:hypothetical protein